VKWFVMTTPARSLRRECDIVAYAQIVSPRTGERQSAVHALQSVIRLTKAAADPSDKNPASVAWPRPAGLNGGQAPVDEPTPGQLRKTALKAARARWCERQER
jgi:hypothetical protein